MGREWKPGEVWLAECETWAPGPQTAVRYNAGWYWLEDSDYFINDGDRTLVTPLRPLVVIDPEDIDLVASLWQGFGQGVLFDKDGITAMQDALRKFANPIPPPCRASVAVHINTNHISASCDEPVDHEGSHRSKNGTHWDATGATA